MKIHYILDRGELGSGGYTMCNRSSYSLPYENKIKNSPEIWWQVPHEQRCKQCIKSIIEVLKIIPMELKDI